MIDLYAIWGGFGAETKAALIGAVSTCLVAAVGFVGLFIQLGSQGKQSREAIAENERRRIKAAMYEDAVLICRELADSAIGLSTLLRIMMMQIELAARAASANLAYDFPSARFPAITAGYAQFSDSVLRFIFLVENRRIIDPRVLVFRTAMSVILHDTRDLMHSKFVINVMPILPREGPDGILYPYNPPLIESAEVIKDLSNSFISSLEDAISYADDFLVELQNYLLGDLFSSRISPRRPLDPSKKVITLADAQELERWFETSTQWGKTIARVEAETAARFGV